MKPLPRLSTKHELESIAAVTAAVQAKSIAGRVIQGVNVRDVPFFDVDVRGAVFVGCDIEAKDVAALVAGGAIVVPRMSGLPFSTWRRTLYSADELMDGYVRGSPESFKTHTLDARIYGVRHGLDATTGPTLADHLAMRLHDLAIDDALEELLHPREQAPHKVVAIMGGHALGRDAVEFAAVARLAAALTRAGYLVATGGGPGAMEAANLGAMAAGVDDAALTSHISELAKSPKYANGKVMADGYFERAWEVRSQLPSLSTSLGIPTWFYGHEPTNLFCSHVAKYFSNALREEGLLAVARHGVIFAPKSGPGTMQEVFQDACQNAYATYGDVSPMVFLGRDFWMHERPAPALLQGMVRGKALFERIAVVDDVDAAVAFIAAHPPVAG
jgi:hypothetical protein